jgi:aryl-alcohol dehydrogenase-like predicted oxidoreductase
MPMAYARLGRCGVKVSRIALGTMNFGPHRTPEPDAAALMDRALEAGINFFDTANDYGQPWGTGATESLIGRWLATGGGRREKLFLATKVHNPMGRWPNRAKLSAYNIRRACEASLRRLQTDHIDLYQMHHVDRDTPWEEIWQAMDQLVAAGKITYVGSSNFAGWDIATACQEARRRGRMAPASEQSPYSLTNRAVEREVIPACRHYGLGLLPYSPLGAGLLTGILGDPAGLQGGRRSRLKGEPLDAHRPQLERYEALCAELGRAPAAVAVAWLLTRPAVCAAVCGAASIEQLDGLLEALDIHLGAEVLERLDAIFPPAGTAPEYYAW